VKKFEINLAMIAVVLGITAAFALAPAKVKAGRNVYYWYAVKDGASHYSWETSPPAGYSCQSGNATCEISVTTTGTPAANELPASYTPVEGTDKESLYKSE